MALMHVVGQFVWWLMRSMFWSGRAAWRFFTPRIRIHPTVERVTWWRTVIGVAVAFTTLVRYDALGEEAFTWALYKACLASITATLPLMVVMAVAVARAMSDRDVLIRRLAHGPLVALAVWNAVLWSVFIAPSEIYAIAGWLEDRLGVLSGMLLLTFFYLLLLWALIFVMVGTFQVYRNVFNAGDGHPLMPALVAPWFSAAGTLAEIAVINDLVGGVPAALAVSLSALGTLCVAGLSWWEYRFITRTYGITLRAGALRIEDGHWAYRNITGETAQ